MSYTQRMIALSIAMVIVSFFSFFSIYSGAKTVKIAVVYSDLFEVTKATEAFLNENNVNFELEKIRFEPTRLDEIFRKIKNDGIKVIIGPSYSEEASSMFPFLQKYGLYAVSPTVTSGAVVGKGGRIISMCVPDSIQVRKLIDAMEKDKVTDLFVFAYAKNRVYVDPFVEMMKNNFAGTVVVVKVSKLEEITPEILEKAKEFSGILFVTPGHVAGYGVSKLEELGYAGYLYASDYALDEKLLLFDSELIKNLNVFTQVSGQLRAKKGADFVGTYNALLFVKALIENYGRDIKAAFEKAEGFSFQGLDGPVEVHNYYADKGTSVITLEELMTLER